MHTKSFIYLCFILLSHALFSQNNTRLFSQKEVLEDLEYLYQTLPKVHRNLFAYTDRKSFDATYRSIKKSITKDSFNLLEVTNLLQPLISSVKNGHTEIPFPGQSYREYAYAEGTLFPLEIAFEDDKCLVRKNFSNNKDIKIGAEVLSVNGRPMGKILQALYPHVSAERMYFKLAKMEFYSFPRLYWQVFGQEDEFNVEIRTDGITKKYVLKAINLIQDYENKREEVLNAQMKLDFIASTAYLNPGSFGGDEMKYRTFIDSAFATILEMKSKNLIIDLKNNSGGNDPFSDYLISYIADRPFSWSSAFSLKTSLLLKDHARNNNDTTSRFFQEILNRPNGEVFEYRFDDYQPQAPEKRFKGKVYVLVNRQSHSQSTVAASQIQDYKFGTIVGEETGEYPSLYASQFKYPLPNTNIVVSVSKGHMIRVNESTKQEGVIPDILIKDHLRDEKDEILEGLLKMIH